MPIYCCETCKKTFEFKTDYVRHINKKFKCKTEDETTNENLIKDANNMYICNKCNKIFEYKSQFMIHINSKFSCIENDKTDDKINLNKENNKDDLLQLINVLKNELIEEKNKNKVQNMPSNGNVEINGNNNTTTNTNNSNNVTNNILINAYGKEDLSHITDNDYKTLFTKCNSLIPMLIELIHYNKDKPENTNVYISNIKSPNAYVYDGNKWILRNKSELIDDIYDNKCIIVIDKFDDMKKILNNTTIELFNKFIEKHDTDNMRKSASDKIELILYNNRDLVKNNK